MHSETIDITTPDGTCDAFVAHPGDGAAHPAVLLYMDAIGLRPALRGMAEKIAGRGYYVLVPNSFYRSGRAPLLDIPDILRPERHDEMMTRIFELFGEFDEEMAMRDARAFLDFLGAQPEVRTGPVGITGYCMGGPLALRTAGAFPEEVAAAASFHGGHLATEAPNSPHRVADRVTAELYFGYADADPSMPQEQIDRLEAALTEAGVRFRSELYEGAAHGFTMPDVAAHHAEATEQHWDRLFELLDRALPAA